jgi:hypothetical protein
MVTINYRQTKTHDDTGTVYTWTVETQVLTANGCPPELFVHDTGTKTFQHVATPHDVGTWPSSYDAALSSNSPYYRTDRAHAVYEARTTAEAAASHALSRLNHFVSSWEGGNPSRFDSIVTGTIDSDTGITPDEEVTT